MSSRVIKFRVWDTEYKEFSNWTNRDPFFDVSNGQLFFWERVQKEDGSYDGDIILEDLKDRFVLQQFTGLHDKNGKEIYEGDIVSLSYREFSQDRIHQFSVTWDDRVGGFDLNPTYNVHDLKYYQIVGNIFENPNALK